MRPSLVAPGALGALATLVAALPLAAQEMRTLDVARQLHDSAEQRVVVRYGVGRIRLHAAPAGLLYVMRAHYNEWRGDALHRSVGDERLHTLGVRLRGLGKMKEGQLGELDLALTAAAPLDLRLELGGASATLDLGGLRIAQLRVHASTSETELRFDEPNQTPMRELVIDVGAAKLRATGLGHAGAAKISVEGEWGHIELDFDGRWTQDVALYSDVVLGALIVRVPRGVGVRLYSEAVLSGFTPEGLVKRGSAYYSENWDSAAHHLLIQSQTLMGKFRIERLEY